MPLSSTRKIVIVQSGDFAATNTFAAATNALAPNQSDLLTLNIGNNVITPPSGGSSPTGVTIIPPASYTGTLTLKGIAGDTGIPLSVTDPTSLGLGNPAGTFVISVGVVNCIGIRLVWS